METQFTPLASLAGGVLVGLAALILMYSTGRIAGISGILAKHLPPDSDYKPSESGVGFLGGLLLSSVVYLVLVGFPVQTMTSNWVLLVGAGLLVGLGTVIGNGCTSGHGVCGISRLSIRSIVATITFLFAAAITVFVLRHVVGG